MADPLSDERLAAWRLRCDEETSAGREQMVVAVENFRWTLDEIDRLRELTAWKADADKTMETQSCGHPRACIAASDEGTLFCRWCDERAEMQRQIAHLADEHNQARAEGCEVVRWEPVKPAPNIDELEKLLEEPDKLVRIRPNGTVEVLHPTESAMIDAADQE